MKIIYKGMKIDSKIEENRVEQLLHDDNIHKLTKITVKIPSDNFTLTLIPSENNITEEGLVSWGDNTGGYLNDTRAHVYEKAGVYDIIGQFIFGLGVECTESMKNCLVEVKNLSQYHENLSNAFANCWYLISFNTVTKINPTTLYSTFAHCKSMVNADMTNIYTDITTTLADLFTGCDLLKELNVSHWNTSNVTTMWNTFCNCKSLTSLDVSNFDTSKVTNMNNTFGHCNSLTSLDVSEWDVSKVENFNGIFFGCHLLQHIEVANWSTDSAKYMNGVFRECHSLVSVDLSNWTTTNVSTFGYMFVNCKELIEIKGLQKLNTSNLTDLSDTFNGCLKLQNVSGIINWNTRKVTTMTRMFKNCKAMTSLDLSSFDTTMLSSLSYTFEGCTGLTSIDLSSFSNANLGYLNNTFKDCVNLTTIIGIDNLSVVNVRNMSCMFYGCEKLTSLDLSKWVTSQYLTDMSAMFADCKSLTSLNVSGFVTNNVNTIVGKIDNVERGLFENCISLTSITGIENWNTGKITSMKNMFYGCKKLTSLNVGNFNTANVTDMSWMFYDCELIPDLNVANWNVGKVTDMTALFYGCNNITTLNVANWNVENVVEFHGPFGDCQRLASLDVSRWNTKSAKNMRNMFGGCHVLTSLDVSNFNTSNVTDMRNMFKDCQKLQSLDLSRWDTGNVTNMYDMFFQCYELENLDVSKFNTVKVEDMGTMFYGCKKLKSLDVSSFNTYKVTNMYAMFSYCQALTSLDVSNFNTSNVTDIREMFNECNNVRYLDVSNWNTSNVVDMGYVFRCCAALKSLHVENWDTGKVTSMYSMFHKCQSLTSLDLSNWDMKNVNNTGEMFSYCNKLTTIGDVSNWDTGKITSMLAMFYDCRALKLLPGIGNWNVGNVISMRHMFCGAKALESLDLSGWNTDSLEDIYDGVNLRSIFTACENLKTIKFGPGFNTSKILRLEYMFAKCYKLQSIEGLEYFDTSFADSMMYMFYLCKSLTSLNVSSFDTSKVLNMGGMFEGCQSLTSLDLSNFNTSNVTQMWYMFSSCQSLTSLDLSNFNTSKVETMRSMFDNCQSLTSINLSSFDTRNVTRMDLMFKQCQSLTSLNLSNFDTINVTDMNNMFNDCKSLTSLDVSNFDTSNVTDMKYMFCNCQSLTSLNLSNFDTSNVINMEYMFYNCNKLTSLNLSNFDTNNVTNMYSMFTYCSSLTSLDVSSFDTGKVTNMGAMFYHCKSLTSLDVSGFDTGEVTNMWAMFHSCELLPVINVSNWDVSKVTNMGHMFAACRIITELNLSSWDVSNVTSMVSMFDNCCMLTSIGDVSNWDTGNVTNMGAMFSYCQKINGLNVANWDVRNVTQMYYMFNECLELTSIDVSKWNTESLQTAHWMFRKCQKLTSLDISNWNTGNVTTMSFMFQHCTQLRTVGDLGNWDTRNVTTISNMFDCCSSLESLNVSNWNTSNVTNMSSIFVNCINIPELDVSNWDTRNVTTMDRLFNSCKLLTSIDVSRWNTSKVTNMNNMFAACNNVTALDVSNWNTSNVTNMRAMFIDCWSITSLDVRNWDTRNVTDMEKMFNTCKELVEIKGIEDINTSKVTTIELMFYMTEIPTLDLSRWDTSNMKNIGGFVNANRALTSLNVSTWNTSKVTDMGRAFCNCSGLTELDLSSWDTRNVTNMVKNASGEVKGLFDGCTNLRSITFGENWDTSNVTNMAMMFKGCRSLTTLDVSNWNTSNVIDMSYMFHTCNNLTSLDVSKWNTSNVTSLKMMFHYCLSLTTVGDVSKWDTSNVISMENTFQSCNKLTDINISNWDVSNVKSIHAILHNCISLTNVDISGWEFNNSIRASVCISGLNKVKTIYFPKKHVGIDDIVYIENNQPMHGFLENCYELTTIDFGGFDLTNAEDDLGLFMKNSPKIRYVRCDIAGTLNKIVNYLPVRTVEAPGCLITTASVTNEILSVLNSKNWNIVSLEQDGTKLATYTFDKSIYSSHVPQFNNSTSNEYGDYDGYFWNDVIDGNLVTRTLYTLRESPTCMRFGHIWLNEEDNAKHQHRSDSLIDVEYVNVEGLTNMTAMFRACKNLVRVNEFNVTDKVQYIGAIFQHCLHLTSLDVSNWDTSNITYMNNTFNDCQSLTSLDVSNFDTSKVTTMNHMFSNCNKLTSLDVSNFNTSNVTDMQEMFYKCTSLTSLDVSNFDTRNVTTMNMMFYWLNVEYLDLRNFNTSKVETMSGMFDNCPLLKEIKGIEDFNTGKVNDMRQMFFNCNALTSLDLSKWDTSNVRLMNGLFYRCFNLESLNISTWNTANVTNMESMFRGLRKLTSIDVSNFDTSNVTNMSWMFAGLDWDIEPSSLTEIIGLENWDTSNVTNMSATFLGCDKITELKVNNWNVSNVMGVSSLFNNCTSLVSLDLSKWTFSTKLDNIVYMFRNCKSLTEININGLNTVNVRHMTNMFYNCSSIKYLDCSSINIDSLLWNGDYQLGYLFGRMTSLTNLNISQLDLTNIVEYELMFDGTPNLELISCNKIGTIHKIIPLIPDRTGKDHGILLTTAGDEIDEECMELLAEKNWEATSEVGMLVADYIFDPEIYPSLLPFSGDYLSSCVIVDETIENYVVEETSEEVETFGIDEENYGIMTLEEPSSRRVIRRKIYNVKEKKPSYARFGTDTWDIIDNRSDSLLEVKYLDIENCTYLYRLFGCCSNLIKVDGVVITNKTDNMQQSFHGCRSLVYLNTEGWDVSNVLITQGMFQNCDKLTSIDVSNWNTSKVTIMNFMFQYCKSLTSLDVSNWDTSNVTDMRFMFKGCQSLTSLDLSNFDTSKVNNMESMFNACYKLAILDISNFTINADCVVSNMLEGIPTKYLKLDDVPSLINIIDQLPTKTTVNKGHVVTYNPARLTITNINLLKAKNWEVHSIDDCTVAAYGFDNTIHNDLMPIFNEDYDTSALVISDHVHGGYFVHRDIMNFEGKLPSTIKFGGDEPDARTNALMQIGDVNLTGITNYSEMFKNCTNLNYLNICVGEKTPTNVSHMFEGCSNLELFDIYGMKYDGITSYEGMFAGCNKLCKVRVKDIQNAKFMNILQDTNNNFANVKELVSSHVHDLTEEERGVIEGLGWGLKGMVAHYAYDNIISKDYLPVFNEEFIDFEVFDYLNERQGIMHRTIESNMLPTMMRFGNLAGEDQTYKLLEVYDMDTRELTTGVSMFGNCMSVSKISCDWKTSKMTDMSRMFAGCQKMTYVDVSDFDTSIVTNMNRMFHCCHMLSEINVSGFDTSKVTDMGNMFYGYLGTKTLDVSGFDTSKVTNMSNMFYNCYEMTELDVSGFNTSKVTNMGGMFYNCKKLTSLDVSNWDTSNVIHMYDMFNNCISLTSLDVSNFDTSNVTAIYSIFLNCKSLKFVDTSRWNIDNVKDMLNMFNVTQLDHISLSNWSMLKGALAEKFDETTQHNEFIGSGSLISIDFNNCIIPPYDLNWMRHTPNLKLVRCNNADSIVNLLPHLLDRSIVTTQEVVTYEQEYVEESDIMTLELDYEEPELVPVVNTITTELEPGTIISDAELSEETLAALAAKNWNVVTSDAFIKVAEYVYDPDVWNSLIPEFNAEFINYFIDDEEIEGEAANGTVKTLIKRTIWSLGELPTIMRFGTSVSDISSINQKPFISLIEVLYLNTSNVTDMNGMFRYCVKLAKVHTKGWDTSNVTRMDSMFCHCQSLTSLDVSNFDTSNVIRMISMFNDCRSLTSLDVSNFNTSKVNIINYMFSECQSLTSLDLSNFDTRNVTTMEYMFHNCQLLTSLDVSSFDTSKVTDMNNMFNDCKSLTSLDVSNFDTRNVTRMDFMFSNCQSLTSLDVSKWDVGNVSTMYDIFAGCNLLEEINMHNWEPINIDNMVGMFNGCHSISSIDLSSFNTTNVYDYHYIFNNCQSLVSLDISNFNIDENSRYSGKFVAGCSAITDIGMVHCDVETINIVAGQTPVQPITIWIGTHLTAEEIASLDQYDHITYSIQLENAERLLLSSPLLEGDEIKVVDGQLCHVHNMGIEILDKASDSGTGSSYYAAYFKNNNFIHNQTFNSGAKCNYFKIVSGGYAGAVEQHGAFIGSVGLGVPYTTVNNMTLAEFNDMIRKEPIIVIYRLAEPWTEVIDLPRANIDVELYENGVLYMSDPTASTNRVDSNGNMIIDAVQGDSVVNVSNQQFSIELSEENNTPIQTGEITEDNSIRPKFYGRTMVNLMDRIGWEKFIHPTANYGAYIYNSQDITNKSITITNFNDKPIDIGIQTTSSATVNRAVTINANSTVVVTIDETENLFSITGKFTNGWTEENMHELKNVNIFEGELSEDELPENRMNGMRHAFDNTKVINTNDANYGKYKVSLSINNSPISFGTGKLKNYCFRWLNNTNLSSKGVEEAYEGRIVSDYYKINENKDYEISITDAEGLRFYFYNENKEFLYRTSEKKGNLLYYPLDYPDDAVYFRIRIDVGVIIVDNVNDKIKIKPIDKISENRAPLVFKDNTTLAGQEGNSSTNEKRLIVDYVELEDNYVYQINLLASDTVINFYDADKVGISRFDNNGEYYEDVTTFNSTNFPEGTKFFRLRIKKNDIITIETVKKLISVIKCPVEPDNSVAITWLDNYNLESSTGDLYEDETAIITNDYIEKEEGFDYKITELDVKSFRIYFFDNEYNYISRTSQFIGTKINEIIEFPEGVKYFKFKVDKENELTINNVNDRIILKKIEHEDGLLYTFGLVSDVHIDNGSDGDDEDKSNSLNDFTNALRFFENEGVDFLVGCGDMIKDYGSADEDYTLLLECLGKTYLPNYLIPGNHDSSITVWNSYIGTERNYTIDYNNDIFAFVGYYSGVGYVSAGGGIDQRSIDFIRNVINNNPGKRIFVMQHPFIRGYGVGSTNGASYLYNGSSIGDDYVNYPLTKTYVDLVTKAPNVILCHGHSHFRFILQDYFKYSNAYHAYGECYDIHIPSCSRTKIVSGNLNVKTYYEGSEGYLVKVFSDRVEFKAIDFTINGYISDYDQIVNLSEKSE